MIDRANGITRKTFDSLDHDGKLGILFDRISWIMDILNEDHIIYARQQKTCNGRFLKIEKSKIVNTAVAGGGGIIGGIIAVVGKAIFWR